MDIAFGNLSSSVDEVATKLSDQEYLTICNNMLTVYNLANPLPPPPAPLAMPIPIPIAIPIPVAPEDDYYAEVIAEQRRLAEAEGIDFDRMGRLANGEEDAEEEEEEEVEEVDVMEEEEAEDMTVQTDDVLAARLELLRAQVALADYMVERFGAPDQRSVQWFGLNERSAEYDVQETQVRIEIARREGDEETVALLTGQLLHQEVRLAHIHYSLARLVARLRAEGA